jgi:hypothetical protein
MCCHRKCGTQFKKEKVTDISTVCLGQYFEPGPALIRLRIGPDAMKPAKITLIYTNTLTCLCAHSTLVRFSTST